MTLLKKRGCTGCQPAGEPLAGEGKASPDPLFFPKRHASYAGILIAFLAVTFVAGGHIDFSFLDAAKDFPGGFVWFVGQFMPNAKAFDQMGKIASALAMTILDAIAAGTLAAVIAFILAVIASRVSGVGGPVQMVIRAFATVLRNIPTVAWIARLDRAIVKSTDLMIGVD
ncbi:PhnE/PtxC family ABC transporter permease [Ellagibacter isourolithinifaciens]|uniref:PhnE/PtxC family ABC transporter permease n=1 Tax=Ellagibacter isourolithinifaciens TaxID=2137581 RepID=UPI003A95B6C9